MKKMKNAKKLLLSLISLAMMLTAGTSCSNGKNESPIDDTTGTTEISLDATDKNYWHYYSISGGATKFINKGLDAADDEWAARIDWDFAIQHRNVRTNGGTSTTKDAKGALYTFGSDVKYSSITSIPAGASFEEDKIIQFSMPPKTSSISTAVVAIMGGDMSSVSFSKSPCYAIRSANGENLCKIEFTQYKHPETEKSGHVKFNISEIK